MRKFGGALLASSAAAAIGGGFVDSSMCSIDDGSGGGGGGGGAAGLLDDDAPAAGAPPAAGDPPAGDPPAGDPPAPPAAGDTPDWLKSFSAEKVGEDPSHQDWLKSIGVKDLDGLAKLARDNQKALRDSGRIKIPGENATDEERAAFREAIGAPKEAAGYEVKMPEGAEQFEIDTAVLDPLREVAHKHGVPATAFKELADVFLGKALEDVQAEVKRTDQEAADKLKEWGPQAEQKREEFRRGAQFLGLTKQDIQAIQREWGAGKVLDLFAKVGAAAGEDFFSGNGNPAQRFGIANEDAAQRQLDAMINDKATADLLRAGDKATVAKYNTLTEAVAGFRKAAAGKR